MGDSTDVVSFPVVCRSETDPYGTYELTYVVYKAGRYQLTVRHDGRHIDGSPFTVEASDKELVVESSVTLNEPTLRTKTNAHRFKPQQVASTAIRSKTSCGATKRPASSPPCNRSCTLSRQRASGIQRQTTTTQCVSTVSTDRSNCTSAVQTKRRQKTMPSPTLVPSGKLDSDGDCLNNEETIIVNNMSTMDCDETPVDGRHSTLLLRVGRQGRNKGEFVNPQGVCCTKDGLVLVADSNNACVQVRRVLNNRSSIQL